MMVEFFSAEIELRVYVQMMKPSSVKGVFINYTDGTSPEDTAAEVPLGIG